MDDRPSSSLATKIIETVRSATNYFSPESDAVRIIRNAVLRGAFMEARESSVWRTPSWKLLVFVSSTFTDTNVERDILMKEILPNLRKIGQSSSVDVTLADMRWGVRDENTLDHRTWIECSRELERCRQESSGIFFLSLQSDK